MSTQKNRKLLDEVRDFMRLHHYSIHTERTYCDWIRKNKGDGPILLPFPPFQEKIEPSPLFSVSFILYHLSLQ